MIGEETIKKLIILLILSITAMNCRLYDSRDWSEYNKLGKERLLSIAENNTSLQNFPKE